MTLAVEDSNSKLVEVFGFFLLLLILKTVLIIGWRELTAGQQLARFGNSGDSLLLFPKLTFSSVGE